MKRTTLAAAGVIAALAVLAGCGGGAGAPSASSSSTAARGASASSASTATSSGAAAPPTTSTAAPPPKRRPHRPAPGSLPQTRARPSEHSASFAREMNALWRGVRTNSLAAALPAFFPKAAYAQVKAISDPDADWRDRLVGTYRLDIAAAHALLSAGGAHARLLRVRVPSDYAHWVNPGACYNRVGYWEVPNARVIYRDGGAVRSFGIASMISWRGVWYVVHLGAVSGDTGGTVDAPSAGPGVSAPSLTC